MINRQRHDHRQANAQHRERADERGEPDQFLQFAGQPFPEFHAASSPAGWARWLLNLAEDFSFRRPSPSLVAGLLTLQLIEQPAELLRNGLRHNLVENTTQLSTDMLVHCKVASRGGGILGSWWQLPVSIRLSFCHGHLHRAGTHYILRNGTQRSRTLLAGLRQRAIVCWPQSEP